MEKLTIDVDREEFWFNFCVLKSRCDFPLPVDFIQYNCYCEEKLSIFKNGDFFVSKDVTSIPDLIEEMKSEVIREHFIQGKCTMCKLTIDAAVGLPEFLTFGFDNTIHKDKDIIQPFAFEESMYNPTLCVFTRNEEPVLVIFVRNGSEDNTYQNIVMKNFKSHLNVSMSPEEENDEEQTKFDEEKISDDDGASQHQHLLPRMSGGGRKMMQEFKYMCQWCSEETLKQKTRGRFMELKNYRDHFRKVHQDVPFAEFLNNVERDEPKFHCKICNKKISLGNQLRHQIICRPPHYQRGKKESSSDSTTESDQEETVARKQKKTNPDPRKPVEN